MAGMVPVTNTVSYIQYHMEQYYGPHVSYHTIKHTTRKNQALVYCTVMLLYLMLVFELLVCNEPASIPRSHIMLNPVGHENVRYIVCMYGK